MPAVIPLAIAAGSAISGVVGAKMQSNANHDAANVQSKAATDTLAFQREQQAQQQAQFEQTQHSNYDQWAADEQNQFGVGLAASHNTYNQFKARDQRVGQLGELLGMAPRVTPDLEDPTLTIPPYQGNAGSMTNPPSGSSSSLNSSIADELRRANSSDDPSYWARVIAQHGDGPTKNWSYWQNRIRTGDGVGKGYHGTAADMLGAH